VQVTASRTPDYVNECNCSLCAKSGWRGIYFGSDEVRISGELDSYKRSDLAEAMITIFRCARCGIPTHWEPLSSPPHDRIGLNARLFDPIVLEGLQIRQIDGRSWDG
jgi:hypothetical protein